MTNNNLQITTHKTLRSINTKPTKKSEVNSGAPIVFPKIAGTVKTGKEWQFWKRV
jgi:hypothetical protein